MRDRLGQSAKTDQCVFIAVGAVILTVLQCFFDCPQAWALREGGGSSTPLIRSTHFAQDTCSVIGAEASRQMLPEDFFARLIWKESLFNPNALSHKGAEGIAQFMPDTASERGLEDAFDPAKAIAASASYLADLREQFGSLGLAAAAYNAGPTRVENWLSGAGNLPAETQEYVHFVTGFTASEWVEKKGQLSPLQISDDAPFSAACPKLATRQLRAMPPERPFQLSPDREPSAQDRRKGSGAVASTKKSAKTSSPNAPAKKTRTKSPPPPWGVEIAANVSQEVALAQFSRTKARFPSILKGSPITGTSRRNRSKALLPLHTVRLGAQSRAAAEAICNKLRSAGGACLVVKS